MKKALELKAVVPRKHWKSVDHHTAPPIIDLRKLIIDSALGLLIEVLQKRIEVLRMAFAGAQKSAKAESGRACTETAKIAQKQSLHEDCNDQS